MFLCKVKKKKGDFIEKNQICFEKLKKKRFLVYKKIRFVVGHKIKKTFERVFTFMR